jgi:hypothetical protein
VKQTLVFLVAVVLFAGCGAVEDELDLAAVVSSTQAKESWRLEAHGMGIESGKQVRIACHGAADHARRRAEITCSSDDSAGLGYTVRAIDDDVYDRFSGQSKWAKAPADARDDPVAEFSPHRLLSLLRAASVASEYAGDETVRGASTTRYRLTVNCEEAELADCGGETSPVDVWIAEDDTVRRISLDWDRESFTVEFFDFGAAVDIEPPPAEQIEVTFYGTECHPGEAAPIRARQATDALQRAGFKVRNEEDGCSGSTAASFGIVDQGVNGRETLKCAVFHESRREGEPVDRHVLELGTGVVFSLANLECAIFAAGAVTPAKIRRLSGVFDELERAIRP